MSDKCKHCGEKITAWVNPDDDFIVVWSHEDKHTVCAWNHETDEAPAKITVAAPESVRR